MTAAFLNFRGCDACEEWYHGDCINITEKDAKHIKQFFCVVSKLFEQLNFFVKVIMKSNSM